MKNTTWVFGSMFAAGCMLLSVPAAAQGGFPQDPGRNPAFPAGPAAGNNQAGAKPGTAKTNSATTRTTSAKSDKAALEAAKYQLSNHRTDLIKSIVDGYASSEDLSDPNVVRSIHTDIEKKMPLVPAVPLEKADLQALNEQARKIVDDEYGADDKKYASVVEAEAAAEFPLYKIGDKVVVNYNMGPKHYSVSGKLYRVTENAITVEDKVINLIDLNDETRSRFDPQKNKYMRARYIETHIHLLNRIKLEKIQDTYDKLKGEIFKRNETAGYIYDPTTDHWASAQEIAKIHIDRQLREQAKQQRTKQNTAKNDEADDEQETPPARNAGGKNNAAQPGETAQNQAASSPVNEAVGLEDNAESRARYKAVMAKAETQKKEISGKYAGIDADSGYKNACWGFTIADTRYALWQEPEFPFIEPSPGHDTIKAPEDIDLGVAGTPASIDLVYVSNSLSKVIYIMKDCSRQDFIRFKDSLTEQYGHAVEDKGLNSVAFTNIFSGKTKPQQIADADAVAAAKAAVDEADKAYKSAAADLKNATPDDRAELQEKRNQAAAALKDANDKLESFKNAVTADDLPYVYSLITLAKDDENQTVLPYTFTWKGKNVTGTLIFYYDKARDRVTDLVFAKESK